MEIPEQETEFRHYFYVRRRGKKNVMLAQEEMEEEQQGVTKNPKRTLLYLFISYLASDEIAQLRNVILKRNTTVIVCYQKEETGKRIYELLEIMLQDCGFPEMLERGKIQFTQLDKVPKEETEFCWNDEQNLEYQLKRSYKICWERNEKAAMVSCGGYFFEIQREEGDIQKFAFEPVDYFISLLEFMNQRGPYQGYVQLVRCKEQGGLMVDLLYWLPEQGVISESSKNSGREPDLEEFLAMFESNLNGIPIKVNSFEVKKR